MLLVSLCTWVVLRRARLHFFGWFLSEWGDQMSKSNRAIAWSVRWTIASVFAFLIVLPAIVALSLA
jgi:cytochrome b561